MTAKSGPTLYQEKVTHFLCLSDDHDEIPHLRASADHSVCLDQKQHQMCIFSVLFFHLVHHLGVVIR